MGEVCTGAGSTGMRLSFDPGFVDFVGLASVSSRRRFPRRSDSSTTFPTGGLAGVDDATGLNAPTGEDWMTLSVGMTRFDLVKAILRGDGTFRERAADTVSSEVLISEPLTGVRGNADATGSAGSASGMASPSNSARELREGSSTGRRSHDAGGGNLPSARSDGRSPN